LQGKIEKIETYRITLERDKRIAQYGMSRLEEILTTLDNKDPSITSIKCCESAINDAEVGSIAIATLLHDPNTVTELKLMSNNIGDTDAENTARLLKQNTSLIKVNLQKN
jgi:hypothetical protein